LLDSHHSFSSSASGHSLTKTLSNRATGIVFEVYKDKGDHYRFRVKEGDTTLAIASKGYDSKEEVMKVIAIIQKEAAKGKIVEEKGGKDE
jgi:uncharacterized protein YegP (UPF0339 family)